MLNRLKFKLLMVSILFVSAISTANATLILNLPMTITEIVTIQPIIVSDSAIDGGGNEAKFFGTATQKLAIEGLIDQIWAQAGIDVNFLAANTWEDTFANWGAGGPPNNGGNTRPTSDLNTIVSNGAMESVTNADPLVINMFFVQIAAGFDLRSANSAAGLAFVGGNGITQYVGINLLSFEGGQEAIATVVAHEIGHNLGLFHSNPLFPDDMGANLMWSSGRTSQQLNASQMAIALNSNLSVTAVPLPAAFWFMTSGILMLFRAKKVASI